MRSLLLCAALTGCAPMMPVVLAPPPVVVRVPTVDYAPTHEHAAPASEDAEVERLRIELKRAREILKTLPSHDEGAAP